MSIPRPLLICGIAAFSAALTIGVGMTTHATGPRPFRTGEPRMADLLKKANYPATIELIDTPDGAKTSVSTRAEDGNEPDLDSPPDRDTFIVR
jgi:UDP-N-acetylmuramyl tripeptide synthase